MSYDKVREHLDYPEKTMYQLVEDIGLANPKVCAYEFMGKKTSYASLLKRIDKVAKAFQALGIKRDDRVTLCLPNVPQAVDCFYSLDRIGAVANMVHPQSAQNEITFYLNISKSKAIVTLDMFTETVEAAVANADHPVTVIVARMQDELLPHLAAAYVIKTGKQYLKYPNTAHAMTYKDFLKLGKNETLPDNIFDINHTAAILYSGGTSGLPKGICLTDANFNATALQAREAIQQAFDPGMKILTCMPLFHGFGLGINLHTAIIHGITGILMPTFTPKSYAQNLMKKKPNFIAGVPTIFDALLHIDELEKADLSFLLGMFCGGDSLTVELKKKIDTFLKEHNASIQVREGYGLTECVTASCLTPRDTYKPGSIGLPFPDTVYAIVRPGTDEVMPAGEEGEIILRGPSVMKGYLDNEEETNDTLRKLPDGNIWLYTGDLGMMDEDGYIYFKQRIKRMIITNGYNVYPGQLENVIDGMPEVAYSCVIGVKDPRRVQRVRAYVVLNKGYEPSEEMKQKIMDTLKVHIAKYALPKEIVFKDSLPKTLVGKVAFRKLEEEANSETSE